MPQVEAESDGPDVEARQKLEALKAQLGILDNARSRVEEPSAPSGDAVIAQSLSRSYVSKDGHSHSWAQCCADCSS